MILMITHAGFRDASGDRPLVIPATDVSHAAAGQAIDTHPPAIDPASQAIVDTASQAVAEAVRTWAPVAGLADVRTGTPDGDRLVARVRKTLEAHARRRSGSAPASAPASGTAPVSDLLAALVQPTGGDPDSGCILRDVLLAEGLELSAAGAVRVFEAEFMPLVRAVARRTCGDRGLDMVGNFAADLMLPRGTRPPKIARYGGLTPLKSWLRVVVANHCLEALRGPSQVPLSDDITDRSDADPCGSAAADGEAAFCENLLRPAFQQSVESIPADDRLLIRLLLLDDVPQSQVARSMGIHSGNVTRRRQKATQAIWDHLRRMSEAAGTRFSECLQLVLAGTDASLRQSLGSLLTSALRDA